MFVPPATSPLPTHVRARAGSSSGLCCTDACTGRKTMIVNTVYMSSHGRYILLEVIGRYSDTPHPGRQIYQKRSARSIGTVHVKMQARS